MSVSSEVDEARIKTRSQCTSWVVRDPEVLKLDS